MRKITPIVLSEEQQSTLQKQLGVQEPSSGTPKSRDPINFPVFENPVNKKVLVYVPKHIVQNEEGVDELRMDKPLIHSAQKGKKYFSYRCISGIQIPGTSFTGECPLCDGCSAPWDLANTIIEEKCKTMGLDPKDTENKQVKDIRSSAFSDRELKDANRYYTFPIVVFDTVNDDGKNFVKDADNNLVYKIMWYNVSESQYEKTWVKALEAMEDEPNHPGGNFFLLNYCYTPKRGEPNKRDSARELSVSHRNIKGSEELRKLLDSQTEEWTPAKAQETVINNAIYSREDLEEITEDILENTNNLLALYSAKGLQKDYATGLPEGNNFNLTKANQEDSSDGEGLVDLGDTDADLDMSDEDADLDMAE